MWMWAWRAGGGRILYLRGASSYFLQASSSHHPLYSRWGTTPEKRRWRRRVGDRRSCSCNSHLDRWRDCTCSSQVHCPLPHSVLHSLCFRSSA
ncbi:hypothetical protein DFP72DRAFT_936909 [Ephemerocybe angulata]|uniref:Uncharacterized protein n=1 Tax=Ephemerocybe angulata TaxID=980116 RepID=A0A8H6HAX7_9AGAR|nr:hypothetical protein DFP72DRAFT_936909 [Tulosesus angulatus]